LQLVLRAKYPGMKVFAVRAERIEHPDAQQQARRQWRRIGTAAAAPRSCSRMTQNAALEIAHWTS
jgi:hypothetical protein